MSSRQSDWSPRTNKQASDWCSARRRECSSSPLGPPWQRGRGPGLRPSPRPSLGVPGGGLQCPRLRAALWCRLPGAGMRCACCGASSWRPSAWRSPEASWTISAGGSVPSAPGRARPPSSPALPPSSGPARALALPSLRSALTSPSPHPRFRLGVLGLSSAASPGSALRPRAGSSPFPGSFAPVPGSGLAVQSSLFPARGLLQTRPELSPSLSPAFPPCGLESDARSAHEVFSFSFS